MKIKLAILEKDREYLSRVASVFENKYADKLQVYAFTELETALQIIQENSIDVFIANEIFDVDTKGLPVNCGFAYLVESNGIQSLRNEKTIGKYQMVDQIYKQVLSIFSEVNSQIVGTSVNANSNLRIISIMSPAGGVGTSTVAASFAVALSAMGNTVLYLNLEKFASTDLFFHSEGIMTFSDVIYALKGRNTNVQLKLESAVKRDSTGVYYYSECKNALDIEELNCDDLQRLIESIQMMNKYNYLIIDCGLSFDEKCQMILNCSNSIRIVSDGTEYSNNKVNSAINTIKILDRQRKEPILPKTNLIYNRFRTDSSQMLNNNEVKMLYGMPVYKYDNIGQLIQQMSDLLGLPDLPDYALKGIC